MGGQERPCHMEGAGAWENTHHTAPVGPAAVGAILFNKLDDVELVVVVPNVGLVQRALIILVNLNPKYHGIHSAEVRMDIAPLWGLTGRGPPGLS